MTKHNDTDYTAFDLSGFAPPDVRPFMAACIAPRPVALVTTTGPGGVANAAPYSNVMAVSSAPPLVALGIGPRPDGGVKDTLRNLRETGAFTINAVPAGITDAMHHTAADYPSGQSEMGPAGLSVLSGVATSVARVAESPIHLECRVFQIIDLPGPPQACALVLGQVLRAHVVRDILRDGVPDALAWTPLGGLGEGYVCPGEVFSLPYPTPNANTSGA